MHHGAAHRDERIFQGGASGRQLIRLAVPEPDDKKSVQRDDFALLQFGDFFLLSHQVCNQGVFALRNRIGRSNNCLEGESKFISEHLPQYVLYLDNTKLHLFFTFRTSSQNGQIPDSSSICLNGTAR